MFVKMHKKRGKSKHIKYTYFSPFLPPFLSRPAAFGGRARLSAKFHPGNHPAPWGAHFFFSLIFSRVVYISFSIPLRTPFRPSAFHSAARSLPGGHSTPVDSFADIFFLFCCCRKRLDGMGKIGDGIEKMNGWRAVG